MIIDEEKFIEAIRSKLEEIGRERRGEKTEWTSAIKRGLIEIAESLEFDLSSNCNVKSFPNEYKKHDNHEWLYDIVLYKATKHSLDEIWLCVESEWSRNIDDIFWDFAKLLQAKSKVRLLVFDCLEEKYNETVEKLKQYVQKSKICQIGEVYLFAAYPGETEELKFDRYKKTCHEDV